MFSNKKKISVTHKSSNEDCFYLADDLAFVIDGASGLDKVNITNEISDAAWYSHKLKEGILKYQKESEIRNVLSLALREVNDKYRNIAGFEKVKDFPSAVIAMARKKDEFIEVFVLGDCMLVLEKNDLEIERIEDTRIEKFDKKAILYGIQKSKEVDLDFCDTKEFYHNILVENRNKKNKKNGYFCLSDEVSAINEGYVRRYNADDLKSISIMSDGFSQIINLFHLYDDKSFVTAISNKDINDIYSELYEVQNKDDKMNLYPRLSKSDDATLLYFELK